MLGAYAFASFAPAGPVWGLHALAYFSPFTGGLVLATCALALLPGVAPRLDDALERAVGAAIVRPAAGALAVAAVGLVVFYAFPIHTDIYGDSRNLAAATADNTRWQWTWVTDVLRPDPMKGKEALTQGLHRALAFALSVPIVQAYRIGSACSGAAALLLWLLLVRRAFADRRGAGALALAGVFTGANAVFFGHVENYAFPLAVSIGFLAACFRYFDGKASLWTVLALFAVTAKAHLVGALFLPAVLYLLAYHHRERAPGLAFLTRWKPFSLAVVLPTLTVGALLYFFTFRSFAEPHSHPGRQFAHTFLAVVPSPPPLDRYTLFSLNHVLDLVNVLLLVGAPAIVLVLGLLALEPWNIEWGRPRVMFFSLAAFYPLAFFIMVNPELSMPRDWDLYGLVSAPLLLWLAASLVHRRGARPAPLATLAAVFACFPVAFMVVNTQPGRLSRRLMDVGEHVYRTYYGGAPYIIATAAGMEPDPDTRLDRLIRTAEALEPVVARPDPQFTHLAVMIVELQFQKGDYPGAIRWSERALANDSTAVDVYYALSVLYGRVGDPRTALGYAEKGLAKTGDQLKMLKSAIMSAIVLGERDLAHGYLARADRLAPGDPGVDSLRVRLEHAAPGR